MERSFQKTKIVATVGPACSSYDKLLELVNEGVDVFRLNFSHGTHDDHKEVIDNINKINELFPFKIAMLGDLQGPKLRIGKVENNSITVEDGDELVLTNEECLSTKEKIFINYPSFCDDIEVGESIMMDDGRVELVVVELLDDVCAKARVINGGELSSNKGINLPNTKISLPSLTKKDLIDVAFAAEQRLDWVALSFVRDPKDVIELKELLFNYGSEAKVIAKIEKPQVTKKKVLRDVIVASDGIMVARGDLGVELPVEQVPMIQKEIIRMCIHRAKPVIIATQMLDSMTTRTRPNRSEITDVANAVLEGADALMLSGETAVGKHPNKVIRTMANIITEVEKEDEVYNRNLSPQSHSPSFFSDALCYSTCNLAEEIKADALIGTTQSGYTGFMLSSYRPKVPLYIFTKTKSLVHQLSLSWGVKAFFYDEENSLDEIISDQINILKGHGVLSEGDVVCSTGSTPVQDHLPTNLTKITRVK